MIVDIWSEMVVQGGAVTTGGLWYYDSAIPGTLIANGILSTFSQGDPLPLADPVDTHLLEIDFCYVPPGNYTLKYVTGTELCSNSALITISVTDSPVVGVMDVPSMKLCQVNGIVPQITLYGYVLRSSNGNPYPDSLLTFDWSDGVGSIGVTRQITIMPAGGAAESIVTYTFTATVTGTICEDSAEVGVTVGPNIFAGDPGTGYVCEESGIFDLNTILTNAEVPVDPNVSSQWLYNGVEVVDGLVNVDLLMPGNYTYTFRVAYDDGTGECESLTNYTLTVVETGEAGEDVNTETCNDSSVHLFNVHNAGNGGIVDEGGAWVYFSGPGPVDGHTVGGDVFVDTVNFAGADPGVYTFRYTVGNVVETAFCETSADLIIEVLEAPAVVILEAPLVGLCRIEGVTDTLELTTELVNSSDGLPYIGIVDYAWEVDGSPVGGNTSTLSFNMDAYISGLHLVEVFISGICVTVSDTVLIDIGTDLVAGDDSQDEVCN